MQRTHAPVHHTLSFSFSRFLSIRLSFLRSTASYSPSPFNSRAASLLASFSVLLLNHSRSVASLSVGPRFPFSRSLRLLTRSFVATAVASDTVSNGSGGHTILRLNSTDTAAQRRSFSSYSFPSFSIFLFLLLFLHLLLSSFSLSCSLPPFAAPSDHTPPYSFFFFPRIRAAILTIIRSFSYEKVLREGLRPRSHDGKCRLCQAVNLLWKCNGTMVEERVRGHPGAPSDDHRCLRKRIERRREDREETSRESTLQKRFFLFPLK